MAPTAATRARTNKAKPKDDGADTALSEVLDEKTGKKLTIQQLKNKLRNEAEREVLDAHKDEVHRITGAKYQAHGLEYVRRLSEEEKAAKLIEELHAKFPNLRPQAEQQQAQREIPRDVVAHVYGEDDTVPDEPDQEWFDERDNLK